MVDIEADGPSPNRNSMLSIGAVATTSETELGTYYRKLATRTDTAPDAETLVWWQTQPKALAEVNLNPEEPKRVINEFISWVESFSNEPIFVANPVTFDYTFVAWYIDKFADRNPFIGHNNEFKSLDLRSYITGKFSLEFADSGRRDYPKEFIGVMPMHTHRAIDDALGYAILLRTLLNWGRQPNPYKKLENK